MKKELSPQELEERVAILRRYKALLEQQRAKFQEYLKILESQEAQIDAENAESVEAHAQLGERIVGSISTLQKVIEPIQMLYSTTNAASYNPLEAVPVEQIQSELKVLNEKVQAQNEKNRELLENRMTQVRTQIMQLRNPYRYNRSVYAERAAVGTMVYTNALFFAAGVSALVCKKSFNHAKIGA